MRPSHSVIASIHNLTGLGFQRRSSTLGRSGSMISTSSPTLSSTTTTTGDANSNINTNKNRETVSNPNSEPSSNSSSPSGMLSPNVKVA